MGKSGNGITRLNSANNPEIKGISLAVFSGKGQKRIIKTYKEGNRGSQQMSKAQVYLRVRGISQELEVEEYPSRSTVYRILKTYVVGL